MSFDSTIRSISAQLDLLEAENRDPSLPANYTRADVNAIFEGLKAILIDPKSSVKHEELAEGQEHLKRIHQLTQRIEAECNKVKALTAEMSKVTI